MPPMAKVTQKKKMNLPPEALEFFRLTGSVGGSAKVKKGFGAMDEDKKREIQEKALATRRKNALKKAAKKTPAKTAGRS
jgi:hypothetical protein